MSTVRLVSVVGFRWPKGDKSPQITFGATDSFFDNTTSQWVFRAGNVPVDGHARSLPAQGRTLFYGFTDAIKEIGYWQGRSEQEGMYFHSCYVDVEVGVIQTSLLSKDDIASCRFASMRRFKTDLLDDVLDFYREKTARPSVELKGMQRYADIASTPWLLDDLLATPDFSTIEVMVYPLETGRGVKNFAFLKSNAHIEKVEQNLQLPWRIEV